MNEQTKARIKELQKEKDVVILAHYYVDGEVQEIADYVGDSYYLAKVATDRKSTRLNSSHVRTSRMPSSA